MHIYVHVPFCARRCSYCDFAIAVRRETPSREFHDAIVREWDRALEHGAWDDTGPTRTIYFGGGTPSRLDSVLLTSLISRLRDDRPIDPELEITIETNPEDVTAERAAEWASAGVRRVSLGVQSFDPRVLAWMHRTHTAAQVPQAMEVLRGAGISNLSLDLIYALPAELHRDWAADLETALALEPSHISLYGLTVEDRTPLARWRARGEVVMPGDDRAAAEYLRASERLSEAGFEHYEVSNAGRPGQHSRHNAAYWSGAPYLGLGPSAHGLRDGRRWWNVREWAEYQRRVAGGHSTVAGEETLTETQRYTESLYLGLRTWRGVSADRIPEGIRKAWVREGWAVTGNGRISLTPQGWLRLDALVAGVPDP